MAIITTPAPVFASSESAAQQHPRAIIADQAAAKQELLKIKTRQTNLYLAVNEVLNEEAGLRLENGERIPCVGHVFDVLSSAEQFAKLKVLRDQKRHDVMLKGRELTASDFDAVETRILDYAHSERGQKRWDQKLAEERIYQSMLIAKWGVNAPEARERLSDTQFDFFVAANRFVNVTKMSELAVGDRDALNREVEIAIPALQRAGQNVVDAECYDRAAFYILMRANSESDWFGHQQLAKIVNQATFIGWDTSRFGEPVHPNTPRLERAWRWDEARKYALD